MRDAKGRFVASDPAAAARAEDRRRKASISQRAGQSTRTPAVEKRVAVKMLRRGAKTLMVEDRALAVALRKRAAELLAGVRNPTPELVAEAQEYAKSEAMLNAVDAYILQLGDRVVNRRRRMLHQIAHDRRQLAESLGAARERIARFREQSDILTRLEALEDGRTIDGDR